MSADSANATALTRRIIHIGELAIRSGRSVHTLRYYESLGLLPFVSRDAQGRRSYNAQHVQWLAFLDRLQRSGMSLEQMKKYAEFVSDGVESLPLRIDLLKSHLDAVLEELKEIQFSQKIIEEKIHFYERWQATGKRPADTWTALLKDPAKPGKRRSLKAGEGIVSSRSKRSG